MPTTFLVVEYAQRSAVKALGARWDPQERKWYVPDGRDVAPFSAWLPSEMRSTGVELAAPAAGAVHLRRRGISLSELLAGITKAVARAYQQGQWTVFDVVQATVRSHVFLEVAERDSNGVVLAKASAIMWANVADEILPAFEAATGMSIGPGMKLLVRARPVFSPQHGFRLFIDAIDPDFTLGELEARKREIRARLQQQGLWGANKALEFPWDFNELLVIAPAGAAGLGDFRAEAQRLDQRRVCTFIYAHSRFQGPGAAEEIIEAAQKALAAWRLERARPPDAVVFIRGGGAVNDLGWLNHYDLARFVCELGIPVLTGIGHERDSTILDEVAHTSFDTPSKVIAGIEATVVRRTREAQMAFTEIVSTTRLGVIHVRQEAEHSHNGVRAGASRHVFMARASGARAMTDVRLLAMRGVARAGERARDQLREVDAQARTHAAVARQRVPLLFAQVRDHAQACVRSATDRSQQTLTVVLDRGRVDASRAAHGSATLFAASIQGVQQEIISAGRGTEALMREISGQGPQKTLARGFAHVRDAQGQTVMSAHAIVVESQITVTFHDGTVPATVDSKEE